MKLTKAQTLQFLKSKDPSLNILPVYILNSSDFFKSKDSELQKIISFAGSGSLIVRSSSSGEDNEDFSNAGGYESVLNVSPTKEDVRAAVEKVYASYNTKEAEEILIQPMLENITKSGVVFTADIDTFADYYTVNYSESGSSSDVTGGFGKKLKTFVRYKNSEFEPDDNDIKNLLLDCKKIERILENNALDIEFAVTSESKVFILQARPIARGNKERFSQVDLKPVLSKICRKVEKLSRRHPFLLGETTCFGVMPDWNPAEILGVRPKKLAISLYKELITDNIWAHQRNNYGYRNLTSHPLMVSFCGIPYIDTRVTFNSFIPKKLNDKIAEKLLNYYLQRLKKYPKYHDKIEFEIVYSCYFIGIGNELKKLLDFGFNENETKRIEFALLDLTNSVINPTTGLYKKDIEQVTVLKFNYERISNSNISRVDKIYWLMEECKLYGTLPFAGVARAAFIAVHFLKSFVKAGIISQAEYDAYMNSLFTVNEQLSSDLQRYYEGGLTREEFLERYGHIRPGTYDIMSKRYDEDFEYYFERHEVLCAKKEAFAFSDSVMERIQLELEQNGLCVSAAELMQFMKESIEGREKLKFEFTKLISEILVLIEELGLRSGITKEDMAHLDISVVKQLYSDLYSGDVAEILRENIDDNKRQYECALQVKLPAIIINPQDVYQYYLLAEEPNFITQKSVYAETVALGDEKADKNVNGKIVFIQSADPGYDYLFSHEIGGLVTQYGGANSHMAIRCAELGIPAVIGAGEQNYKEWNSHKYIMLDCLKKQVLPYMYGGGGKIILWTKVFYCILWESAEAERPRLQIN